MSPQVKVSSEPAHLYTFNDGKPYAALIDGVVYHSAHNQETARIALQLHDLEAELLQLVPESTRNQVNSLLGKISDLRGDERTCLEDEIRDRLMEFLPSHKDMIELAFDPESHDMPLSEAVRHIQCTLGPAPTEGVHNA
ncbi:MAG: hypothetical protein ACYC3V_20425 [Chloroflexota bacterium]